LADTYRRRLFDRALDQYGFVTTGDAEDLGVPAVELRKIARRGGVEHVAYGLYRFDDVPHTGRDQYMEAVLRVGPGAHLTHDAVLAFHDLALVNPRRIRVGTTRRVRADLPGHIQVVQEHLAPGDLTIYEGVPSATLTRAVIDCKGLVMANRLVEATRQAMRRGLIRKADADRVLAQFGDAA
jgi:predicted transcriptional regulator of viral defense system